MSFDTSQFLSRLRAAKAAQMEAAAQATGEFAEHVMSESKELVPVSPTDPAHPQYLGTSGALRDSGTVGEVKVDGRGVEVEFGYNADYGAAVHERLDANHEYEGRVNPKAQAKYLEQPIRENTEKFGPYVADAMKGAVGG
ncbi:MAG TPA: HK97 gp10 family phage protein [Tepidisphaeraceae bacterium]|jgi:hypothetical protein